MDQHRGDHRAEMTQTSPHTTPSPMPSRNLPPPTLRGEAPQ
ncbi:TPA: hypothetical protein ACOEXB_000051 [Yersinia enterocolitica]